MSRYGARRLADCTAAARDIGRGSGCFCASTTEISRSGRWDAFFCTGCGGWLEGACRDTTCRFCPGRPAKCPEADRP